MHVFISSLVSGINETGSIDLGRVFDTLESAGFESKIDKAVSWTILAVRWNRAVKTDSAARFYRHYFERHFVMVVKFLTPAKQAEGTVVKPVTQVTTPAMMIHSPETLA
jgi:hypothetical protein